MTSLPSDHESRRRDVIEDVTWLTDCAESPEHIAHRLGYANADNLGRVLEKWGKRSLARRLRPEVAA